MANLEPQPFVEPSARERLAGQLFSFSGIVPLGAFLVAHLYQNALVLDAEPAFGGAGDVVDRFLLAPWVEWVLVLAPLSLHALIGLWIVVVRTPVLEPRPYPPGVRTAMRATGIVALAFVAIHLWASARITVSHAGAGTRRVQIASRLAAELSATWHGVPWSGMAYLVGTACVSFHFVVGCWGFFATTRGGRERRCRKLAGWGAAAAGLAIAFLFANTVVYYATGFRLLGSPRANAGGPECPAPAAPHP